jgi:fimbrial chaperone protein
MRWPAPLAPSAGSVLKGRVNGQNVADAIRQGQ